MQFFEHILSPGQIRCTKMIEEGDFVKGFHSLFIETVNGHTNFFTPFENLEDFGWTFASPIYFPIVNEFLSFICDYIALGSFLLTLIYLGKSTFSMFLDDKTNGEDYLELAQETGKAFLIATFASIATALLAAVSFYMDVTRIITRSATTVVSFFANDDATTTNVGPEMLDLFSTTL